MADNKLDILLHPVRMRIIINVVGQEMTAQQIAQCLPDVAQATLYRHLATLVDAGMLQVVAENPIRGTVEKVYAVLDESTIHASAEEMAHFSKEQHLRYFTAYVASIISDFSQYLEHSETMDLAKDGVSYHKAPLYLSDAEVMEMSKKIADAVIPLLSNKPGEGRRLRLLSTILMPGDIKTDCEEDK